MVKDHQEFNIGVLDIYGFEIFEVSEVFLAFSQAEAWLLELYHAATNNEINGS